MVGTRAKKWPVVEDIDQDECIHVDQCLHLQQQILSHKWIKHYHEECKPSDYIEELIKLTCSVFQVHLWVDFFVVFSEFRAQVVLIWFAKDVELEYWYDSKQDNRKHNRYSKCNLIISIDLHCSLVTQIARDHYLQEALEEHHV